MDYIQLCTTTTYEIGHSIIDVEKYAEKAKDFHYSAIAVSDNNIRCYPSFEEACKKQGIKPIFGYHFSLASSLGKPFNGYLYIKDETGYRNLCKLLSLQEKELGTALLSKYHEGLLLVLQADNELFFQDYFLTKISPDIFAYQKIFQKDFAIGITLRSKVDQEESQVLYQYCFDHQYPLFPFPEVKYLTKQDSYSYQLFQAGLNKKKVEEIKEDTSSFLLSPTVLEKIYREEDIKTLSSFFQNVNFTFLKKRGHLIHIDNDNEILKEKAYQGLTKRVGSLFDEYKNRLDYELSVIQEMNFSSYFLLVEDYTNYAKNIGIKVGPGRGSSGGSLVSYSLGITDIDPIKYDLSFERFLNPKRSTMPDIDIDFEDTRRNEVVRYLENKYGEDRVSTIRTFVCLKPKSALNLIGPSLNVQENRIKKITSLILDTATTFRELEKDNSWKSIKLKELLKDPYYQNIVSQAEKLLGLVVNVSFHAPGVILSEENISTYCPREKGNLGTVEFEYPYMEEMGYLKMDILPLTTLTFIKNIEEKIIENGNSIPDVEKDLNDPLTFSILNQLHLAEIFQLDASYGMKDVVKQVKPKKFSDIPAILALYRPGPIGYIPLYARRKNENEPFDYPDPRLEPVLKETYGIMVYQEQVIKAVSVLASFSAGEADLFRRAISKKDASKMESYHTQFLLGCKNNGIEEKKAEAIYQDIKKFAEYGFNKSHAYSYALITYRLLYYKAHFPKEFYQVSFHNQSIASKTGINLLSEIRDLHYHLHTPDILLSDKEDIRFFNDYIYLPLYSISGVDKKTIDALLLLRDEKTFTSFYDLLCRLVQQKYEKKTLYSLIESGAFDTFSKNRAGMESHLDQFLEFAMMGFNENLLPDINDVKEKLGTTLLNEKNKNGLILTRKLSSIAKKEGYRTFLISDVSKYELDKTIQVDDEKESYTLQTDEKKDYKKGDFLFVKADFSRHFKRLYPMDIILVKEK